MTQLRSCYFCGTTGALSEYATLPDDLLTDDQQPPRVVLCSRCHTKLTTILTPIVERLDSGGDSVRPEPSAPSDGPASETPGHSSSGSAEDQPEVTFSGSSVRDGDSAETAPRSERAEPASAVDDTETADADADPRHREPSDPPADDAEGPQTAGEPSEPSEPPEPPESSASDDADAPQSDDADDPDGAGSTDTPERLERVYHQLLRFLRNREFPIPRAEAEAVAQSAYDLSAAEATEVIQLALDRDVLEARDGELHRR